MIPKATIRTFVRHARELGAIEAKLIEASSIVTAPGVSREQAMSASSRGLGDLKASGGLEILPLGE